MYSPEQSRTEPSGLGRIMKRAGAWALAGVLVAGGTAIGIAYNDLREGVDGPVFDIHDAETHAFDTVPSSPPDEVVEHLSPGTYVVAMSLDNA